MIDVQNVTKTYGKKASLFTALDDVSLSIPDGASVAIVGKSGSGKSTLMHIMSGLDRPKSGQVFIDGRDLFSFKTKQIDRFRAEQMSFIFQSFFVQPNETCYDNVSLPLEIAQLTSGERRKKILSALKAVELDDKVRARARDLSGGQKQRLAIARAIVNSPSILFADEPTGNLDSATGEIIESLLFRYNKKRGATLIIVTHDLDLAKKCDMRIYIKDGKILEAKPSSTSIAKPGSGSTAKPSNASSAKPGSRPAKATTAKPTPKPAAKSALRSEARPVAKPTRKMPTRMVK